MFRAKLLSLMVLVSTQALAEEPAAASVAPATEGSVTADAPLAEPSRSGMRVRWGVNGAIGYFLTASALDFGASGRIGVQVNDNLGAFVDLGYVPGIGFGGSVSSTGGSLSVSGVGFFHVSPMVEGDFGPFFVAGGPMFASGGWASIGQGVDTSGSATQTAVAAGGFMPGFDVRTGFTFGKVKPDGRKSGFTLAVDFKMLNAQVTSVSQSAGTGGASQSVQTGDRIWGMTPMLVLGYDAR